MMSSSRPTRCMVGDTVLTTKDLVRQCNTATGKLCLSLEILTPVPRLLASLPSLSRIFWKTCRSFCVASPIQPNSRHGRALRYPYLIQLECCCTVKTSGQRALAMSRWRTHDVQLAPSHHLNQASKLQQASVSRACNTCLSIVLARRGS